MHKLALPRSDQQRLILLSHICSRPGVSFKGQTLLSNELQQKIAQVYSLFQQAFKSHAEQQRLYRQQLAVRNELMPKLVKTVRLFVRRVRNRAAFGDDTLQPLFAEYQLHPKRNDPNYKDPHQWLALASTLMGAEERLITQGLTPLAQPSIHDLQAAHALAATAALATACLSKDLRHAASRLSAARTQVGQMLRKMAAWLRYRLGTEQAPLRRAIFRSLGFRFTRQEAPGATLEAVQAQAPLRDQRESEQPQTQGDTCSEARLEVVAQQKDADDPRSSGWGHRLVQGLKRAWPIKIPQAGWLHASPFALSASEEATRPVPAQEQPHSAEPGSNQTLQPDRCRARTATCLPQKATAISERTVTPAAMSSLA